MTIYDLLQYPRLIDKIKLLWLGGGGSIYDNVERYNLFHRLSCKCFSIIAFTNQLADSESIWNMTNWYYSVVTWGFSRYSIDLMHLATRLPVMNDIVLFSDFNADVFQIQEFFTNF